MQISTILLVTALFLSSCNEHHPIESENSSIELTENRTQEKVDEAKSFISKNNFDTTKCILIDFSIPSGKNRLIVWSFDSSKVILKSLVTHGSGTFPYSKEPIFSNVENSHCSSLGKYKIGKRGWSNWGIHVNYKLHGLDSTNSNAYDRFIVLHSWEVIPDKEVYPESIALSWGCPAVSDSTMKELDRILQPSSSPVLLWIYN